MVVLAALVECVVVVAVVWEVVANSSPGCGGGVGVRDEEIEFAENVAIEGAVGTVGFVNVAKNVGLESSVDCVMIAEGVCSNWSDVISILGIMGGITAGRFGWPISLSTESRRVRLIIGLAVSVLLFVRACPRYFAPHDVPRARKRAI